MAVDAARRLARAASAAVLVVAAAVSAAAQESPAIVVVDQERLFTDSLVGQRISERLEEQSSELAAENRAIEAELVAEERALTERRRELEPGEFRALADAFDEKVERLRREQDAKTRQLVVSRDAERQSFTRAVGPILLEFMRESGAIVMLDRRSVVATADRVDVTDALIAEIDAQVGAGNDSPPDLDGATRPEMPDAALPDVSEQLLPEVGDPELPQALEASPSPADAD